MSPNKSVQAAEATVYTKPVDADIRNCHYIGNIQQMFLSIDYVPAMVKITQIPAFSELML